MGWCMYEIVHCRIAWSCPFTFDDQTHFHLVTICCGDVLPLLNDLNGCDFLASVHCLYNLLRAHIPNPVADRVFLSRSAIYSNPRPRAADGETGFNHCMVQRYHSCNQSRCSGFKNVIVPGVLHTWLLHASLQQHMQMSPVSDT